MESEKTMFVTGVNCSADTAVQEMIGFDKATGNVAYHAYQSFKPGEATPELCHRLGVELAQKMWGDRYQVLVATHFNTGTYHNHLVVNAVRLWDGKSLIAASEPTTGCGKFPMKSALSTAYPSSKIPRERHPVSSTLRRKTASLPATISCGKPLTKPLP